MNREKIGLSYQLSPASVTCRSAGCPGDPSKPGQPQHLARYIGAQGVAYENATGSRRSRTMPATPARPGWQAAR